MKSELILSVILAGLVICSCKAKTQTNDKNSVIDNLFSGELNEYDSSFPFEVVSSCAQSKNADSYFYTFTFKYKNVELDNFRIIMIPSYDEKNKYEAYTDLGYSSTVNLCEKTSRETNSYSGVNMSYRSLIENATFFFNVTSDYNNSESYNFKITK